MHRKLLAQNTFASLLSQITALMCGFILPRLFLQYFGSEVNGLVNSITQFLSVISFLELGIGSVVQSSLYKPLAEENTLMISQVMVSANKFFQHLARILLVYVGILMIVYPTISNHNFTYLYTSTLIVAISISSFAQYYFGIVNTLLLNADQRGYIQYNAQTITLILNTLVCAYMIVAGGSIQLVKLTTSLIYLARPLVLRIYVNHRYHINWRIQYSEEPIKQKWNGIAQHIAAVILDGTDTIVLTLFSTLSNVSIYSVYFLVVKGVKTLFLSITNGVQALIGELWARQELKQLNEFFSWVEWGIHTGATFVFSCTAALIIPFIQIYTLGINDANYTQPTFAILIVLANAMHCLRLPYNIMVLAAGHYKQTQNSYIIAAILNIVISILTVKVCGLIGVTLGTLAAMTYQTIWLAFYNSKHLILWSIKKILKQFLVDAFSAILIVTISNQLRMEKTSYICWILLAIKVAMIGLFIVIGINSIFFRNKFLPIIKVMQKKRETL